MTWITEGWPQVAWRNALGATTCAACRGEIPSKEPHVVYHEPWNEDELPVSYFVHAHCVNAAAVTRPFLKPFAGGYPHEEFPEP